MNTYIPMPIVVSTAPKKTPKCPHCNKELKGWTEPDDLTTAQLLAGIVTGFLLLIEVVFGFMGAVDGDFYACEPAFSKRYHYMAPTYPVACAATRWLTNKEQIFKETK